MHWRIVSLIVSLPLVCAACASVASKQDAAAEHASGDEGPGGDDAEPAEKVQKKERELTRSRLELKIARQKSEAENREAKNKLDEAGFELEKSKQERDNFKAVEQQLKIAEAQLDVDRSAERVRESQENLNELEKMYAQEEFAGITKELVLLRGRSQLALAQRDLEIETKKLAQLSQYEHPKKLRELDMGVEKAEKALREAKASETKTAGEGELAVMQAEHEVQDLELALAKLKKKAESGAKKNGASAKPAEAAP